MTEPKSQTLFFYSWLCMMSQSVYIPKWASQVQKSRAEWAPHSDAHTSLGFHVLTVTLTWECLAVGGVALRALRHCSAAAGENIYVYGGAVEGNPTDDLMVFNTGYKKKKKILMQLSASFFFLIKTNHPIYICFYILDSDVLSALFQCLSPGHRSKRVDLCLLPCETSSLTHCQQKLQFKLHSHGSVKEFSIRCHDLETQRQHSETKSKLFIQLIKGQHVNLKLRQINKIQAPQRNVRGKLHVQGSAERLRNTARGTWAEETAG